MNKLPWDEINRVFLDMDGTLLDLHFDNHFWLEFMPEQYAKHKSLPLEQGREELMALYKAAEGTLNWYCFDYWTTVLGLNIIELKREVAHLIAVLPDVREFLDALRRAGKRVVLVTNSHSKGIELKMQRTRLDDQLDMIVSSHNVGKPKEHPDFWHHLQSVEPYDTRHTLLIDDSLPVLRSARNYGIRHLLAVKRPDTRQAPREINEFTAINGFAEIMPEN